MQKKSYLEIALKYFKAGLKPIPVGKLKEAWATGFPKYAESMSEADVKRLFKKQCFGIAIVTGGDLEVLDIDTKYDLTGRLFNDYVAALEAFEELTVGDLTIQKTVSGGYHFIYRTNKLDGNKKLARRPATVEELEKYNKEVEEFNSKKDDPKKHRRKKENIEDLPKALLETRGKGGYILVEPSEGYQVINGTLLSIEKISDQARDSIMNSAKAFDEMPETDVISHDPQRFGGTGFKSDRPDDDIKPLDDYNLRADVPALLSSYGWTYVRTTGDRMFYRRPDKDKGISGDYNAKLRLFKTWSTSTALESEKAYTPASLYCELEHRGDYNAAAKALYDQGFGSRISRSDDSNGIGLTGGGQLKDVLRLSSLDPAEMEAGDTKSSQIESKEDLEKKKADLWSRIMDNPLRLYDYNTVLKELPIVFYNYDKYGRKTPIASLGEVGLISGREKSRKTTLTRTLVASAIKGGVDKKPFIFLDFSLFVGDKKIIYVDTEQGDRHFHKTQKAVLDTAGIRGNTDNYISVNIKDLSVDERIAFIYLLIEKIKDIGVIILDGLLDLCKDINKQEHADETVSHVMRWRDVSGALIMGILHEGKSNRGEMMGWLGGAFARKCDFRIQTSMNEDTNMTTIRNILGRERRFESISFGQNMDGTPYIDGRSLDILGGRVVLPSDEFHTPDPESLPDYVRTYISSQEYIEPEFEEIEDKREQAVLSVVKHNNAELTIMKNSRPSKQEEIPFES